MGFATSGKLLPLVAPIGPAGVLLSRAARREKVITCWLQGRPHQRISLRVQILCSTEAPT